MINHILINVWSVAHSCTRSITSQAANLNSFIAQVLVKYLLRSCKKLRRAVRGRWCWHVSGPLVISCAVTQAISGNVTLLLLPSPFCSIKKNSIRRWNWAICWYLSVERCHSTNTAGYYITRSGYHCAKHFSVFISESRFLGQGPCQWSVWPLPCDEEQPGRNTVKWAHLSCNWNLTYRWAEPLHSLSPLSVGLTLFPLGSCPQIIQCWAGLHAFSVWWGQVRLSQHLSKC